MVACCSSGVPGHGSGRDRRDAAWRAALQGDPPPGTRAGIVLYAIDSIPCRDPAPRRQFCIIYSIYGFGLCDRTGMLTT